jgi:flagellar biosynthetic protein FliP
MTRLCSVRKVGIVGVLLLGVATAAIAQARPTLATGATSQSPASPQFEAQLAQFTGGQAHAIPNAPAAAVAPVVPKRAAPEAAHRIANHPVGPAASATDVGGVLQIPGVAGGSVPWSVIVMLTALTLIPSILVCMTPFARLLIVFHFLRQALGLQTTPSNQTLIGLSLILTFFLMQPVANQVYQDAFVPMQSGQLSAVDALAKAEDPMRHFMAHYVREKDVALFVELAKEPRPASMNDVSMRVLLPAYILSELKAGFQIGTVLFLPFLIVDMVVASITTSVGMLQLPPVVISTPLKLLLFLMVDGWHLLISSLMRSFN